MLEMQTQPAPINRDRQICGVVPRIQHIRLRTNEMSMRQRISHCIHYKLDIAFSRLDWTLVGGQHDAGDTGDAGMAWHNYGVSSEMEFSVDALLG